VRVYKVPNPDFHRKVIATYKADPFSVQVQAHMLDERFDEEAEELYKKGLSTDEIGEKLGVRSSTVNGRLRQE
jgi:hypothetical protein